jgi:2-C-methyl-D-erythritol 4-phosphate cytidylyltransferase
MRQSRPRTDTALRTLTPSRWHIQKPQPITREEIADLSQKLTPEECTTIMTKARLMGWAWGGESVDTRDGDSKGGKA